MSYFVVSNGTGMITVILPKTFLKVSEEVKIKGMEKNTFVFREKSLTVIMERD